MALNLLINMVMNILFDILFDIYIVLQTMLPYPWDFVRISLRSKERLVVNAGSYYVTYFLFLVWFMRTVMNELKLLSKTDLSSKFCYTAFLISLAASTQVFWPLFLLLTHFIFCSYYPWITAAVVVYLNSPKFPTHLFIEAIFTSIRFIDSQLPISFGDVNFFRDESSGYDDDVFEEDDWSIGQAIDPRQSTFAEAASQRAKMGVLPSIEFCGSERSPSVRTDVNEDHKNIRPVDAELDGEPQLAKTPECTTRTKMGYCGRCFRHDNLPFQPGFSHLRDSFTTRSGQVYGPTSHVIRMDDYVKTYAP